MAKPSTTTLLLKECSNKMTPMAFCYTHRSISVLSHHQISFFLQQMGTTHKNTARHCAENKRPETLSPKRDFSIKFLPSGLSVLYRRGRKTVRSKGDGKYQGNSVFQTHNRTDTHMNS